jgi:hypothetical protein
VETALAFVARVILAVVLLIAAISKLRRRPEVRRETTALIGERYGPAVSTALPFVEIVLAYGLLLVWTPLPAILTGLLLLGFTAVLIRAQARRLPCPCFAGSKTVGPMAILRNGALIVCAVLATGG